MLIWNEIPRRNSACCLGQESFSPGMEYHSVLLENEDPSGLQRRDFCLECWEKARTDYLSKAKSSWKSKVAEKKKEAPKLSRDEKIFELLKKLLADPKEEEYGEIFFLAIYLARRRRLFLRQDQKECQIYEVAETEEMICVRKISSSTVEITEIQKKIAEKLGT